MSPELATVRVERGTRSNRKSTTSDRRNPLLDLHQFFRQGPVSAEGWSQVVGKGREWESFYRDRWQHDKVVRSTHGVNCTGSCSWNVYVKDGIITWESQAVDYPSTGPDMPDHEPRGCPRGASFSWYTYSPLRVKYPYVRGSLLEMYRQERATRGDPVDAWAAIVDDPERSRTYKSQRGKGGFVRASWDEVTELIAAAHASCFSMALSSGLAKDGHPAEHLETSVEVDFQPGVGITEIRITLTGAAEGLDTAGFAEAAETAKANCPVSKALAAVPIRLTVR